MLGCDAHRSRPPPRMVPATRPQRAQWVGVEEHNGIDKDAIVFKRVVRSQYRSVWNQVQSNHRDITSRRQVRDIFV
jgi:hypothetical protein